MRVFLLMCDSSGVFLGYKIRGADFCSMQKFSLTMKKFRSQFHEFFKNFGYQMLYKKMSFDKDGKKSWAAKMFTHRAEIFA